jgi:ATP-dependent protease ClpP protease subunit
VLHSHFIIDILVCLGIKVRFTNLLKIQINFEYYFMHMVKLNIEGYIGESDGWAEMFGGESNSFGAKDMRKFLEDNADAEELEIEIRSGGGSVEVGIDIYEQLRNSGKKITTIAYECASIATVIFLAGDVRKVTKYSAPLIHNPWIDGWALGGMDADALAELSDQLRLAENRILDIYVERTGADKDELKNIMSKDSAITSDEFKRLGFATEVINGEKTKAHKAMAFIQAQIKPNNTMTKDELKSWFAKIENMITGLAKPAIKNLAVPLKDGATVYVDTENDAPVVGDSVYTDEAYTTAAPDGEHVTSDGKVIILEAGKITEIKDEVITDEKDKEIEALKAKVEELEMAKTNAEAKVTELTQAKAKHEQSFTALKAEVDAFKAMLEAEPAKPERQKTKAELDLEARKKLRDYAKTN